MTPSAPEPDCELIPADLRQVADTVEEAKGRLFACMMSGIWTPDAAWQLVTAFEQAVCRAVAREQRGSGR